MSLTPGLRVLAAIQGAQRRIGLGLVAADVAMWDLAKRRGGAPAKWMYRPGPTALEVQDQLVSGRSGQIPVRVYRPLARTGPQPAVLYLHGGAWLMGCPDGIDHVCREIAVASGTTVASVDYRLAPEHPYPAALEDCADALAWLRSDPGVDPARIAVAGDSAGGNLAAALCLLDRRSAGTAAHAPLRSQILLYPSLDLTLTDPFPLTFKGPGLTLEDCRALVGIYLAGGAAAEDELCSPLLADDVSDLPPALVITAGVDILREDGRRYVERLLTAGVEARWSDYPRMPHAFVSLNRICRDAPAAVREICTELVTRLRVPDTDPTTPSTDVMEQTR